MPWTRTSLAFAASIAVACFIAALGLSEKGLWPGFTGSELLVSAFAGGAVLWFLHRQAIGMILCVFVPLTVMLLFFGGFAVGILMGKVDL